ncbi:MAG TPA: exosortase/archaeosortase family protein [Pirellulales bacterium]|nr:exosortase/archaeosortase family protein [Pirellulales bacterium]
MRRHRTRKGAKNRGAVHAGFNGHGAHGERASKSAAAVAAEQLDSSPFVFTWPVRTAIALLIALFAWSYWQVLGELVTAWNHQPDYSHGWFVVPVAGYLLWSRRADLPGRSRSFAWGGLLLVGLSLAVRTAGSAFYIDAVEAWSIPLWVAGAFWLLGGRRVCWWSLPAVGFLAFMIPLPFHAEHLLSYPLQRVATRASCWLLQSLAQPALQEANVVSIGEVRLNIVEACSGLRIFVSILALAYLYAALIKKPLWTKCALFVAVAPVAVAANALRITLTGLLHVMVSGEAAHRFSHDLAGWLMLPIAAAMLAFVVWYVDKLVLQVETLTAGDLLREGAANPTPVT